ncbi:MAG: cysteine hydrolase [Anaerolineae bacterium]|nr:cysteine hydrolase [Anaerolineae bacterium]MDH7475500.1 isochorismatase family cysteine hydrolase [Anaerolineae bacterium]
MELKALLEQSTPFLNWLCDWEAGLTPFDLAAELKEPTRAAVMAVDMVVGFCYEGPLSSPRVAGIVPNVVKLFRRAEALGVRHFVLTQDAHQPDAVEFGAFGPHCRAGTHEAETIPELLSLPFAMRFTLIPKNSISSSVGTALDSWLEGHPEVDTFIVVGDCTDLCTYQLAMHLRLRANAKGLAQRVIVPVDCVETYDMPVTTARELGILPHDGDLLHLIFLYHMALNGIQVVSRVI